MAAVLHAGGCEGCGASSGWSWSWSLRLALSHAVDVSEFCGFCDFIDEGLRRRQCEASRTVWPQFRRWGRLATLRTKV
jgi:hypothetical protein